MTTASRLDQAALRRHRVAYSNPDKAKLEPWLGKDHLGALGRRQAIHRHDLRNALLQRHDTASPRASSPAIIASATSPVARQSGSESPTIRIRIRDCDVAIVFLLFVAGKRYV
jgi:hypothetical protein